MTLTLFLSFVALATAIFLAAEALSLGARQRSLAVKRAVGYGRPRLSSMPDAVKFRERVLIPAANRLAKLALRLNPRVTVESVRMRLLAAGLTDKVTPNAFLAAKTGFGIGLLVIGFLMFASMGLVGLLLAVGFGFAGFALPGVLVSGRAKRRREEVRAQLPDALDLLAVSVEAGLGFDGAVDKLTNHMDGALGEEFSLTLGEMRIGESRHDALKKLATRVDAPEVAAFARAIIQADQLGISLGRILKVQAHDTRARRQAAAEEKAMKAPIKMLFPTVAFIFPAMFLVVLGPAFLSLKELF
jgi:tight adherence protein C